MQIKTKFIYSIKQVVHLFYFVACKGLLPLYLNNKGNKLVMNVSKNNLKHCVFEVKGHNNTIIIEDGCYLRGARFIMNGNNNTIVIGANTIVFAHKSQPTDIKTWGGTRIEIGEGCLFSNSIEIHTTDYHKVITDNHISNQNKDVVIGNHTWIGLRTVILKGSILPPHSIVGACSLVNKQFLNCSNVLIAGNPASIVKEGVDWEL